MAGYSARQSSFTTGDTILAAHSNDEFNQVLAAFHATTGHSHDGTAGEGGPISTLRDADSNNKILVDTTNNHLEFYVEVSSAAVEQVKIQDGAIVPVTDNDIDLGTSSLEFKDAFFDGTVTTDALVADTADLNGGSVDGATLGTNSAITQAVIDNININGATIGHTDDTDLLTLADGVLTVAGEVSMTTLDIGGTNVTSTAAELNILDGVTSTAAELNLVDGITAGTVSASKAVIVDSNKDLTGLRNLTISGDLTVSGDDITMGTNTAGNLLVADGTNFNSVAVGSLSEISTVADDDVFLAVDTSGGGLKKIARSAVVSGLATSSAISNVADDSTPQLGGNLDMNGNDIVTTSNADIDLAPNGTGKVVVKGNTNPGTVVFNCESNSHGQTVKSQPHSASVTNVLTLPPGGDQEIVGTTATQTLTNKTLTSPTIDGAFTATDGSTITVNDNTAALELISTDADASVGPRLSLYRNSASPADNDILGDIRFMGEDDASAKLEYAKIEAQALDVSDGSIDTQLRFQIRHAGSGNDILKLTPTEAVFNDGSFDTDFRVESNGQANAFKIDAGNDTASFSVPLSGTTGTFSGILKTDDTTDATSTTDGSLQTDGGLSVAKDAVIGDDLFLLSDSSVIHFGADSEITLVHTNSTGLAIDSGTGSNTFQIRSTDGGSSDGPIMKFYRNSSSPADSDNTGEIRFIFNNDAGQETESAIIATQISDVSDGTEDATLDIRSMSAGTMISRIQFETGGTIINQDSADVDFRVESNGQVSAFLVDAGADTASFAVPLTVNSGISIDNITIDGTEIDLSSGDLTIDVAGDITLDAGGSDIRFDAGGTEYGKLNLSGNNLNIHSSINNADIVFKGVDNSSDITALTLDMSDAGTAIFNHDIVIADDGRIGSASDTDAIVISSTGIATFNGSANVAQQALTSSSNAVAWDASTKPNAFHLTTENTTFSAPSNAIEGAFIVLEINYNGSHTIAFNTVFEFAASTAPTFTSTDGKTDILVFRYNGSVWQEVGRTLNLSES